MEEVLPYAVSRKKPETHVSIADIASVRHKSATRERDNDNNAASFTRSFSRRFIESFLSWKLSIKLLKLFQVQINFARKMKMIRKKYIQHL